MTEWSFYTTGPLTIFLSVNSPLQHTIIIPTYIVKIKGFVNCLKIAAFSCITSAINNCQEK